MLHTTLKLDYFYHSINSTFVSKKLFFSFYMPIQMSKYDQIKQEFTSKNWDSCMGPDGVGMIEQAKAFGFGRIGLVHETGDWKIDSEFIAYKIIGEYKQMRTAYKKIMTDYPNASNFLNLYRTDPNITKMEDNITYILFHI